MKVAIITIFPLLGSFATGAPAPDFSHGCVTYSAPKLVPIEGRIVFDFAADNKGWKGCNYPGEGTCSLQGTAKLFVDRPDFSKKGPWNTVFSVAPTRSGAAKAARVIFKDHASYQVRAEWLNEKLVFFSVWWGRQVSTDIVVDFSKQTVLYVEEASHDIGCEQ